MDPNEIQLSDEQIRQLMAGQTSQPQGGAAQSNWSGFAGPVGVAPSFGGPQPDYAALSAGAKKGSQGLTREQIEQQTGKKIISMTKQPAYITLPADPTQGRLYPQRVENPDASSLTITFVGGTSMDVRDLGDGSYGIADSGDAFKGTTGQSSVINTDAGDQWIVRVNPDGTITKEPNPNYRDPATTSTQNNALGWAQLAWQKERAAIEDQFKNRELTLSEAKAKLEEASTRIQAELTKRGQDVTLRGQDISQRGQSMDFAAKVAGDSADLVKGTLPYMAGVGTAQDFANIGNAVSGLGYGKPNNLPAFEARPMQLPFNPQTLVQDLTNKVLAGISPTAAQQVGNSIADVDTTLPNVFTAPKADPAVAAAVAQVPPVASSPAATYTAPTVPTATAVGGKAPAVG